LNQRQWPVGKRLAFVVASAVCAGGLVVAAPTAAAPPVSEVAVVRDGKGRVRAVHPATPQAVKPKPVNGRAPSTPVEAARSHASQLAGRFGVRDAANELAVAGQTQLSDAKVVHFAQTINGVPVIGGQLNVLVDAAGNLRSMNGETSTAALSGQAKVTARAAADTAIKVTAKATRMPESALQADDPVLSGYDPELIGGPGSAATVWKVEVTAGKGMGVRQLVLVNAEDGRVVLSFSQVAHADRRVCDFGNTPNPDRSCPGGAPVARVAGRLAAAGLDRRVDDAAGILQELHGGKTHGGAHQIDEVGNEQAHPGAFRAGWRRRSAHWLAFWP
jgi:Zn-dependent metalloprotease